MIKTSASLLRDTGGYVLGCNVAYAYRIWSNIDGLLTSVLNDEFVYDRVVLHQVKHNPSTYLSNAVKMKNLFALCGQVEIPTAHDQLGSTLFVIDIAKTRNKHGKKAGFLADNDEDDEDERVDLDRIDDDE